MAPAGRVQDRPISREIAGQRLECGQAPGPHVSRWSAMLSRTTGTTARPAGNGVDRRQRGRRASPHRGRSRYRSPAAPPGARTACRDTRRRRGRLRSVRAPQVIDRHRAGRLVADGAHRQVGEIGRLVGQHDPRRGRRVGAEQPCAPAIRRVNRERAKADGHGTLDQAVRRSTAAASARRARMRRRTASKTRRRLVPAGRRPDDHTAAQNVTSLHAALAWISCNSGERPRAPAPVVALEGHAMHMRCEASRSSVSARAA